MSDANSKDYYWNKKSQWVPRPVRDPFVLFFGLPVVCTFCLSSLL